jgi:hypothetical protein
MRQAIDLFKEKKVGRKDSHQICFIISDGRLNKKVNFFFLKENEYYTIYRSFT